MWSESRRILSTCSSSAQRFCAKGVSALTVTTAILSAGSEATCLLNLPVSVAQTLVSMLGTRISKTALVPPALTVSQLTADRSSAA